MLITVLLTTVLFTSFLNGSSASVCDDCMPYAECTEAKQRAESDKSDATKQLFVRAYCGMANNNTKLMVCCSYFQPEPFIFINRLFVPNANSPNTKKRKFLENETNKNDVTEETNEHKNLKLLPTSCGDIYDSRIIGGVKALLYEFPWMVLISYFIDSTYSFDCAGSLINSRYVLTAAHCVQGKTIAGVRVGEYDLDYEEDCQDGVCEKHFEDVPVADVIPHENYKGQPNYVHDIALLRLQRNVNMTFRNVAPICLPVSNRLRTKSITFKQATVTGWGLTEHHKESSYLLKVVIPVLAPEVCHDHYSEISVNDATQFCAGIFKKDSCRGDSGGPLIIEDFYRGAPKFVQYGIVSNGPIHCGSSTPGIYTNVRKYMDWILDHIKE